MGDNEVDLILTDPPYGVGASSTKYINGTSKSEKPYYDDSKKWDDEPIDKQYFSEMLRVSKNQIVWGGNYYFDILGNTRCFIIWDKTIHGNSYADCDFAWASFDKPARIVPINMVETNKDGRFHPTQKPVKLFEWLLKNYAKEGDIIFDPFAGSAASLVACIRLGYQFIGIEKDPEYFRMAQERINKVKPQQRLSSWF